MTKPEVLELIDVHAGTTARLADAYVLHRLWQARDPSASSPRRDRESVPRSPTASSA